MRSFYTCRSQKEWKIQSSCQSFLCFFGICAHVKAAHRMLVKLTPWNRSWQISKGSCAFLFSSLNNSFNKYLSKKTDKKFKYFCFSFCWKSEKIDLKIRYTFWGSSIVGHGEKKIRVVEWLVLRKAGLNHQNKGPTFHNHNRIFEKNSSTKEYFVKLKTWLWHTIFCTFENFVTRRVSNFAKVQKTELAAFRKALTETLSMSLDT